jgi:radical SAM-linked protein
MKRLQSVRRSGLTFAPEAGTQRLRDVINKNLTEESILQTVRQAFVGGWTAVKLYFMLGLPTENGDDIRGIAALAQTIVDEYYHNPDKPKGKTVRVSLSCACFVPKPFTPFQWEPQATLEELEAKQALLRESMTTRKVTIGRHNAKMGLLEGVFARGDRRLGVVIERAWRAGAKFDSWDEHFDFVRWEDAFAAESLSMAFYANRRREFSEILPWSHLNFGIRCDFLVQENRRAHIAEATPNCREKCSACGAERLAKCAAKIVHLQENADNNARKMSTAIKPEYALEEHDTSCTSYRPVRLWLKKSGVAIYTAHLDMNRLLSRAVRRASLPLWYTEGFNPHPYLTFPLPLPLGQGGEREPIDLRMIGEMSDDAIHDALNAVLPQDVRIVDVSEPLCKANEIAAARYRFTAVLADKRSVSIFADDVVKMLSSGELTSEKRSKRGFKTVNLLEFVQKWEVIVDNLTVTLNCVLDAGNNRNLNAQLLWDAILSAQCTKYSAQTPVCITRLALLCADGAEFR